jgi:hypothetical protein
MADDLSSRARGSLHVTGQGAGGTTDPGLAMTAPGGEPAAAGPADHGIPQVAAEHFAASNQVAGGDSEPGASWAAVAPPPWRPG